MASTTIVPFSTLPACATNCYNLYNANGGCVPPAVSTGSLQAYAECFCSNGYVTAFATGTSGVCDAACTLATETSDLASIRNWYTSFCSANENVVATTSTGTSTASSSTGKSSHKSSDNYSWINNHWQWVIFIVVVVVGIVAIWVGACFWHRRYLRNKDRQFALDNIRASTGTASATPGLDAHSQHDVQHHDSMRGSAIIASTGGAAGIPGATPAGSTHNAAPGTGSTYDASTEKRRSNVLLGRRRN